MALIRICISDDFEVHYDPERGMYRLTIFKDGHYQDEYWFDAYGDKECGAPGEAERFRCPHCKGWMTIDDAVY